MRFFRSKKGIALLAAAAVAVAAAVVGYAFFTASGTGTGTATVGTATGVQLSSDPVDGLLPGAPATTVAVHVHNPGAGTQFIDEIDGAVATNGECLGSWFTVAPITFGASVAAGATSTTSTTIAMLESHTNQDACQGKTVTIDWSTGTGSGGGGGGGSQTNTLVLGDCRWDDGSIDSADIPAAGPHMAGLCFGGTPGFQCEIGWDNADGDPSNGCELNLSTDVHNCGQVGADVSNVPHAISACVNGVGVIVTCLTGWIDADQIFADGCEASTASLTVPRLARRATSGWA